ncbi:MAG: hypothetical protein OXH70_13005 [Acidobacteria bacterium]|nr:hypothetical protein [Acidobacteriota bacterium]
MIRRPGLGAASRAAPAILLALSAGAAQAIVYLKTTDAALVDRAPVIVYGEVLAASPAPAGRFPSTDFEVEVAEALKGPAPGGRIVVRQPGGIRPDGLIGEVVGLPMLAVGDRVLLFLERPGEVHRVLGHGLGVFFEAAAGDGRALLLRDASLRTWTLQPGPAGDGTFAEAPASPPRDAALFRGWIADRAAGRERPADYLAADPAERDAGVARAYRVYRTGPAAPWCAKGFSNLRWRRFDRGEPVEFTLSNVEAAGPASESLRVAMDAWNRDAGSGVRLAMGGTTSTPLRLHEEYADRDGANAVTFEDPLDEIPGSLDDEDGFILGAASVIWSCLTLDHLNIWHDLEPHAIPGRPETLAYPLFEANVVTNDGFWNWAREIGRERGFDPRRAYEELLAHELGHALGIDHPCGSFIDCDRVTNEAIMRAYAHGDGRGAALNSDDIAAVRSLYPPTPGESGDLSVPVCLPGEEALCLNGGRYRVSGRWATGDDEAIARAVALSEDTGYFWFFDSANVEIVVKVLDGCGVNGHRWVFAAGLTDVRVKLFVVDVATGRTKTWESPGGAFEPITDTSAFPCRDEDG